jgi:Clathrin adaptor complex small chain
MTSIAFIMMVNKAGRVRFSKYFGIESNCTSSGFNRFALEAELARKCLRQTRLSTLDDPLLPIYQHEDDYIITYRQYSSLCFIAGYNTKENSADSQVFNAY